ncbi:nuclear transport factor 2 family protein [Ruania alba]|uniref:Ketosteroid isomerase-related protein n=1 Tax=Ruania alba TaxID=648782 RepID=A0A1H5HPY3_9MICO|nr:nuclear transport factor 2 family protein [Ruania alba]SEE30037.1 Ketosteroid isomerase-related protein [Ruania alba]
MVSTSDPIERPQVEDSFFARYQRAWSECDIEGIVSMMTPDGVYEASFGPEPWGVRHVGRETIRAALEEMWRDPSRRSRHIYGDRFLLGDRGFSEWTSERTEPDGTTAVVHGADFYRFTDGLVAEKIAYRKVVG